MYEQAVLRRHQRRHIACQRRIELCQGGRAAVVELKPSKLGAYPYCTKGAFVQFSSAYGRHMKDLHNVMKTNSAVERNYKGCRAAGEFFRGGVIRMKRDQWLFDGE